MTGIVKIERNAAFVQETDVPRCFLTTIRGTREMRERLGLPLVVERAWGAEVRHV